MVPNRSSAATAGKIFIGIPTKNRSEYAIKAIESVLAQDFNEFTLIVSDNCSEVEHVKQISAYIEKLQDTRVKFVQQPIDGGEYGQGRFFEKNCNANYFLILHDDDLMVPGYLTYAYNKLEQFDQAAFLSSSQYVVNETGDHLEEFTKEYDQFQGRDRLPEGIISDTLTPLLTHGMFSISGTVFRASVVKAFGFVDQGRSGLYPFEFNVFLRLAERKQKCYYTPEKWIKYRWHKGSMRNTDGSSFNKTMVTNLIDMLESRKFDGKHEPLRKHLLAFNYRNLAIMECVKGDRNASLASINKSIALAALNVNVRLYQLLLLMVPWVIKHKFSHRVNFAIPAGTGVLNEPFEIS